ncbi:MAG: hypothetical protein Kow0092_26940 [Deferrisomatales bacterium]
MRVAAAVLALWSCLAAAPGAAAGPNVLRVGVFDHRPHMVVDGGRISGTDVELTRRVLEAAGYRFEFRVRPPARLFHEIRSGELDVLPGPGITPEREEILYFTSPIHPKVARVFVRRADRERLGLSRPQDLLRVPGRVGFVRGFTYGEQLNRLRRQLQAAGRAEDEPGTAANLRKLLAGRLLAFAAMDGPATYEIERAGAQGEVVSLGDGEFMGWAHIALSRITLSRTDLERIEAALERLRRDGAIPLFHVSAEP